MPLGEPKTTEIKLDGLKVRDFFDKDFIELVEEKFENLKFEHFCLIITEEKEDEEVEIRLKERLSIGHETAEDEKKSILEVHSSDANSLQELHTAIKEYYRKRECE